MRSIIILFLFIPIIMTGQETQNPEHLSLLTTPIILKKGDTKISQGTGFFFLKNKILYLVSNYHVITGSAPSEKIKPLGDTLEIYFHKEKNSSKNIKKVKIPLFTKNKLPVWISSKKYKNADIAVIPLKLDLYNDCFVNAINEDWAKAPIKVRPTSSLTLVGYPYGYYDTLNSLPIWKTGSIASEPFIDFENKPLFLVDISAFPGMSGSPAFAIANGSYELETGGVTVGRVQKFMGVYASMEMLHEKKYLELLTSNEKKPGIINYQSLELGHIWKASLLFEIIESINIEEYEKNILQNL